MSIESIVDLIALISMEETECDRVSSTELSSCLTALGCSEQLDKNKARKRILELLEDQNRFLTIFISENYKGEQSNFVFDSDKLDQNYRTEYIKHIIKSFTERKRINI